MRLPQSCHPLDFNRNQPQRGPRNTLHWPVQCSEPSFRRLPEKSDFLDDLRQRLDDLESDAPVVPDSIYMRIEELYNNVVFEDKVAKLVNNSVNAGLHAAAPHDPKQ